METKKKFKRHYFRDTVDRLIPDQFMKADHETRRKARLVVNFTYSIAAIAPLFGLIYWLRYNLPEMAILITSVALFFATCTTLMLKRSKDLRKTVSLFNLCLFSLLTILISYLGGINSAVFVWYPILPMFAVMLIGGRSGLLWAAVAITSCVAFFIGHKLGMPLPHDFPAELRPTTVVTSVCGTTVVACLIAYLYESAKNHMLAEVEEARTKAEFHRKAAEQSHQRARMVLDSVDQGFVMVNLEGVMNDEHSLALEDIIGNPQKGHKIWEFIALKSEEASNWLEMAWFQLGMGLLPSQLILAQIPPMFKIEGDRYISIACQEVGESKNFLVVVTDITEKVKAEQAQESQKEIIAIVHKVANYGSVFQETIDELQAIVDQIAAKSNDRETEKILLHTLKGSSAVSGMISIPRIVDDLESKLAEKNSTLSDDDIGLLVQSWSDLMKKIEPFLASKSKLKVEVSRSDYDHLVQSVESGTPSPQLLDELGSWLREPTHMRLRQAAEAAKVMAQKLAKPDLDIEILDHGIRLEGEQWRSFWAAFSHAVRNAVDQGIEDKKERTKIGKPQNGKLTLTTEIHDGSLSISIADDGGGICWDQVKEIAKRVGLPHETKAEIEQALFYDGLTTKTVATQISGRGVGMNALKNACEELGGYIDIESTRGEGTRMTFHFPLDEKYVYAA
ncbi:MAG: hypothetical protein HRU19_02165 [Pseudobacteriovorax sp.]|nr:hypothetical protein [Pseudobacteriovorax sp.]